MRRPLRDFLKEMNARRPLITPPGKFQIDDIVKVDVGKLDKHPHYNDEWRPIGSIVSYTIDKVHYIDGKHYYDLSMKSFKRRKYKKIPESVLYKKVPPQKIEDEEYNEDEDYFDMGDQEAEYLEEEKYKYGWPPSPE